MTLDLGDTTFELSYIGGMHTASDTAILVPEHGLLLTGDTMADVWLTDTPGCLASFSVRSGMPHDFPRWLANWDRLLADRERIMTLMPAHWNGELSIEGAEARVEYVRDALERRQRGEREGQGIQNRARRVPAGCTLPLPGGEPWVLSTGPSRLHHRTLERGERAGLGRPNGLRTAQRRW